MQFTLLKCAIQGTYVILKKIKYVKCTIQCGLLMVPDCSPISQVFCMISVPLSFSFTSLITALQKSIY